MLQTYFEMLSVGVESFESIVGQKQVKEAFLKMIVIRESREFLKQCGTKAS